MELRPTDEFRKNHPELAYLPDAALWNMEQNYSSNIPETGCLKKGNHTKMFSGLECDVENEINQFYKIMEELYPDFEIINTTSAQNRFGMTLTITYRV